MGRGGQAAVARATGLSLPTVRAGHRKVERGRWPTSRGDPESRCVGDARAFVGLWSHGAQAATMVVVFLFLDPAHLNVWAAFLTAGFLGEVVRRAAVRLAQPETVSSGVRETNHAWHCTAPLPWRR